MPYKTPDFIVTCDRRQTTSISAAPGPVVESGLKCAPREPTLREASIAAPSTYRTLLVVRLPKGTVLTDRWAVQSLFGTPNPFDVLEIPSASGVFWWVDYVQVSGRGYANEHIKAYCVRQQCPAPH